MIKKKIRERFGQGRYLEAGKLENPDGEEEYYLEFGFENGKPLRILCAKQDWLSFELFMRRAGKML